LSVFSLYSTLFVNVSCWVNR